MATPPPQYTVHRKINVGADDVPDLSPLDRLTLDANAPGSRIGMLLCQDETGAQFTKLGPVTSLDRLKEGTDVDGQLFPLRRPGWPKIG